VNEKEVSGWIGIVN